MDAQALQTSLDRFTWAAEAYPYAFTFRAAQAMLLFQLSGQFQALIPSAEESLRRAFAIDRGSAELASKLLLTQWALGHCDDARVTAAAILALAPQSAKVQHLLALESNPCREVP